MQLSRVSAIQSVRTLWDKDPGNVVIIDTETTSKYPRDARIVDIAVIDLYGKTLLNTLVNPGMEIPAEVTTIHGIGNADVANAPIFSEIYDALHTVLRGRHWVIYNSQYDEPIIDNRCMAHGKDMIGRFDVTCAMKTYAKFYGEAGRFGDYKWQSLSKAVQQCGLPVDPNAHRALADCLMTLEVLKHMATVKVEA